MVINPNILKLGTFYWLLPGVGFSIIFFGNFFGFSLKISADIFYIFCAVPAVIWALNHRETVCERLRESWFLWLFLAGVILVSFVPGHHVNPIPPLYLCLLWLVMLALHNTSRGTIDFLFKWHSLLSLGIVIWATQAWVTLHMAQEATPRIQLGEDMNPIHTALLLVLSAVWYWEFYAEEYCERKGKIYHLLGFLAFSLLVLWTITVFQARSALLGFMLYLGLKILFDKRRWLWLMGFVVSMSILWLSGIGELLLIRGLSFRPEIWSEALNRLNTQCGWLFGCGKDHHQFGGQWPHVHSAYMAVLYDYGVIVMLLFCVFAFKFFSGGLGRRSRWTLVAAIGWGGVIANTNGVVVSYRLLWVYFWIPTFLAILEMYNPKLDSTER